MPNLRVDRQQAIRDLAAVVRKKSAAHDAEVKQFPAKFVAAKRAIIGKLEKIVEGIEGAKTPEALTKALSGDMGYQFRKDLPCKPTRGVCQHAKMLKQLQMDTRTIIPVSEKDMLWTLLVDRCED